MHQGGNGGAGQETARQLLGRQADREVILPEPGHSVRWREHDYPSPLARWNYHPELEIHLIREGSGAFIVGDYVGAFLAGQVCLIGSGLPHDWVSDLPDGELIRGRDAVIQFDRSWVEACGALIPELQELDALLDSAAQGIEFLGEAASKAAVHIEAMGTTRGVERFAHLAALFGVLVHAGGTDRRLLASRWLSPAHHTDASGLAEAGLDYLFTHYTGEARLAEAAAQAGCSPSSFSKRFTAATGQSFSDVLRKIRVAHACRALRDGEALISTICFDAGFNNLSNFNRQFLRETGTTPKEYRRQARAAD